MAISKTDIAKLYIAMFDRAPEGEGLDYWYGKATNGESLEQIANEMASAAKAFPDDYPQYANYDANDAASVKAVIDAVYKVLFNKDSSTDPEGVNYWVNHIVKDGWDLGKTVVTMENAAEEYLNSDDEAAKAAAQTFVNRADVAVYSAEKIQKADVDGDGKIDFDTFKNFITSVTDDKDSITTAKSSVDEYTPVSVDLTTGKDTITGSKAADTFNAALLTLNDGDSIDGKDGVDTLNVEITNNVTDGVTVKNVENVNVTAYGARTINMKNFTGVENFTDKDSTGTLTLNNVNNNMKLAVEGTSVGLNATFTASALQGSADTLDVTLKEAKSGNVTVNAGFENAKLHIDGNSTLAGLTVPGVNTLVTDGKGDLTIGFDLGSNFNTQVYKNDGKVTYKAAQTNVSLISAQDNTAGFVDANATTKALGTAFANDLITLKSNGTVLLGSGNDKVYLQTNGTNTIRTGDGADIVRINQNATGDNIKLDTGAGDDKIYVSSTTALNSSDVINTGEGSDSVVIADSASAFAPTLKGVEELDVKHDAGSTINLTNADSALKNVNVYNSTAGQNITLQNLGDNVDVKVDNWNSATPTSIGNLSVAYKNQVDSKTFDINTVTAPGATLTIQKVTNATVNYNNTVASAGNGGNQDFQDSQTVTITAKKAAYLGAIASTNNKTETLKITGSDLVTTGNLTSTALKDVDITAEKALTVGAATASNKLNSVKYTSNTNTVDFGNIGSNTVEKISSIDINGAKNIGGTTAGTIDAKEIGSIKVTSTKGAVTLGAIDTSATGKIGDVTVSAKTNVTFNKTTVGGTDYVIGSGNDSLESLKVTATDGAITFTNAAGGAAEVNMNDSDGFDVSLTANTTIQDNAGNAFEIKNAGGNIGTVTLSGNASAKVNLTASASGKYVNTVDASGLKGGLTTTITNSDNLNSVSSSTTVSLGAKDNNTSNSVTFTGKVDSISVNGSDGKDTITLGTAAGDTIKSGTISLGAGTDKLDLTNLDGIKTAVDGAVINLSSSSQTVGSGSNQSTVSAGKIVEFDGSKVVDGGYSFTVSGVDQVTGTNSADIIYAANTGTTITGGAGNDTIHLGAGNDTVVFENTAANNGNDTVTNFTAGSDKIDVSAFETAGALVNVNGATFTITNGTVYYLLGAAAGTADNVSNVINALNNAATITDSANTAWLVISDDNSTAIYEWTGDNNNDEASGDTFNLIATLDSAITNANDILI